MAGPILSSGVGRVFTVPGNCGIPVIAEAVSENVMAMGASADGYLTALPWWWICSDSLGHDHVPPGITRLNGALVTLSKDGARGAAAPAGDSTYYLAT